MGEVQKLQCEKGAVGRDVVIVIVIVRNCCISLKVVEVVVAKPSVKRGDMSPLAQSSVDGAC